MAPLTLTVAAMAAIALAVAILATGPVTLSLGPFKARSSTAGRPLGAAFICAFTLLGVWWRSRRWRSVATALLIAIAPLALLLGRVGTTYPTGDGALIELYTLHAIRGQQALGAYSQYGWHHPGPLSFYILAPFYVLGGDSTFGLGVGVLFVNLGSLAIVAWIVARETRVSLSFAVLLFGFLTLFAARIPQVLSSGWNPHTPLLPLVALVFVTASSLDGRLGLLPLAALLTSFVVQTHVGFSQVAGVLFVLAAYPVAMTALVDPERRSAMLWRLVATVFVLEGLWAGPLAEQVLKSPGNMTLILRFFFNGHIEQTVTASWIAWSTMLAAAFRPSFVLAAGSPFVPGDELWPRLLGTSLVLALVPAAIHAWRGGRRLVGWVSILAFVSSLGGAWSTYHIRGPIGDYHIFWLAPLGLVSAACIGAEATAFLSRLVAARLERLVVRTAATIALISVAAIGCRPYVGMSDTFELKSDGAMVRRLTNGVLTALPRWHATHPIVRCDDAVWATGAGLVLQLERANIRTSVAPEMVWLFGENMAADGTEDVLLTVSRAGRHVELAERPGNNTIAEGGTFYVDAISLIDQPEARPR